MAYPDYKNLFNNKIVPVRLSHTPSVRSKEPPPAVRVWFHIQKDSFSLWGNYRFASAHVF